MNWTDDSPADQEECGENDAAAVDGDAEPLAGHVDAAAAVEDDGSLVHCYYSHLTRKL